ncbi:MAG TPA: SRPBCC family protein [Ktedonobacterales bacterium]
METLHLTEPPIAKAQMLIRRPVADVFAAFVDPAITSKFWFTHGSSRLEAGKQVQWDWEMYDASIQVNVKAIEENKRILIEWPGYSTPTLVEWTFTPRDEDTTFVTITNTGFTGTGDEIVKQALDATGGFTFVLAGLKAFLEHNITLNLIADHNP